MAFILHETNQIRKRSYKIWQNLIVKYSQLKEKLLERITLSIIPANNFKQYIPYAQQQPHQSYLAVAALCTWIAI
jgi:hypothetical protein